MSGNVGGQFGAQVNLEFSGRPVMVWLMTAEEFKMAESCPVANLPLQALWQDAHGDWERAHGLCQEAKSRDGDWVHAYLHRKEGDEGNAGYWYSRAGRPMPAGGLEAEWTAIVTVLLK